MKQSLPTFPEQMVELWDSASDGSEVFNTIKNMQSGNAPGSDNLSTHFYEDFRNKSAQAPSEQASLFLSQQQGNQPVREANRTLLANAFSPL